MSRECLKRQKAGYWDLHYRLQVLVTRSLRNPDEPQGRPLERLSQKVESLGSRIEAACGGEPVEWAGFKEARSGLDEGPVDRRLLRVTARRFETWASTIGQSEPRITLSSNPCRAFRRQVSVEYVERYQPAPWGQRAWVELRVDNGWWSEVYGMHDGDYRASGVLPDGRTRELSWGGSSADSIGAGAGRSSTSYVWPVESRRPILKLTSDGQIYDVRFRPLYMYGQGTAVDCRVPLRPASP